MVRKNSVLNHNYTHKERVCCEVEEVILYRNHFFFIMAKPSKGLENKKVIAALESNIILNVSDFYTNFFHNLFISDSKSLV